jgi:hypothetical protein
MGIPLAKRGGKLILQGGDFRCHRELPQQQTSTAQ